MKSVFIPVIMGGALFFAGCVQQAEPEFAMRNAQTELDLQSVVRGQANVLLSLAQSLETQAERGFSSPRKLERDLEAAIIELDQLQLNLPELLAEQDVELATLRKLVDEGAMDKSSLRRKREEIRTYRKALITSLDASMSRAALARKALEATPHDLEADMARDLNDDLDSARTTIAMQL